MKDVQRTANGKPRKNHGSLAKTHGTPPGSPEEVLPPFDIHDLRHTHATHLLQEGWSVAVVSRRLGHANPAITLAIYAHVLADTQGDNT